MGCTSGSGGGGGAADDKVGEAMKDVRESSFQSGRRLRGGKMTGRKETGGSGWRR